MTKIPKTKGKAIQLIDDLQSGWFVVPKSISERKKAKAVGVKLDNGRHSYEFRIERKGKFYSFVSRPFNQPKRLFGPFEALYSKSEFDNLRDFVVWAVIFHDVDFQFKAGITRGRSFKRVYLEFKNLIK